MTHLNDQLIGQTDGEKLQVDVSVFLFSVSERCKLLILFL